VCVSRESNLQSIQGPGRSIDTSHGPPVSHKRSRLTFSYPHRPAPTTPRAHTADCHSRCRPPRAVGHHHRAQRTRRSMQGCTRGGGSWAMSPAEAGCGVGRVFLPTCECARAACARLDLGERADGNTSHAPRADVPCHAGCTARDYRRRRDVLGGVVARARRRVPRHRQGGLPCKSCWSLNNAVGIELTSERGHQSQSLYPKPIAAIP